MIPITGIDDFTSLESNFSAKNNDTQTRRVCVSSFSSLYNNDNDNPSVDSVSPEKRLHRILSSSPAKTNDKQRWEKGLICQYNINDAISIDHTISPTPSLRKATTSKHAGIL